MTSEWAWQEAIAATLSMARSRLTVASNLIAALLQVFVVLPSLVGIWGAGLRRVPPSPLR